LKDIINEGIRNPGKYLCQSVVDREFCERQIAFLLEKIDENLEPFSEKFPAPASKGNVYPAIDNTEWTSSFWTGMLWLAYEVTGKGKYREAAEKQLKSYKERLENRDHTDTHDLGFLYTLSCVAAYRLTGSEEARDTALKAADMLMERYYEKAGIIQAWGDLKDPEQQGRMIIDCCMNLPLLHWSVPYGRQGYRAAAIFHADRAAEHIVREDASSYHTFYMDVETGKPKYGKTAQGYSDNSCWARGQAWGIYGFALSYRYTQDSKFTDLAVKLANYFLNRLPEDSICYWDLAFTEGGEERDSSAAAIVACGLLELAKYLPLTDPNREVYERAASVIIRELSLNYTTKNCKHSNGILLHAVYSKPAVDGVDECNIWGDYFYFEALVRLIKDWKPYW
jgi:unsaturated chondroitin disaccharide hydrolase